MNEDEFGNGKEGRKEGRGMNDLSGAISLTRLFQEEVTCKVWHQASPKGFSCYTNCRYGKILEHQELKSACLFISYYTIKSTFIYLMFVYILILPQSLSANKTTFIQTPAE